MLFSTKEKIIFFIIGILFIGVLYLFGTYIVSSKVPTNYDEITLRKLDSLKTQIDILQTKRDSVIKEIHYNEKEIIETERVYEMDVARILTQSADSDKLFLTNYIRQYESKLDSLNSKTNQNP